MYAHVMAKVDEMRLVKKLSSEEYVKIGMAKLSRLII